MSDVRIIRLLCGVSRRDRAQSVDLRNILYRQSRSCDETMFEVVWTYSEGANEWLCCDLCGYGGGLGTENEEDQKRRGFQQLTIINVNKLLALDKNC